jgi:hypothetical protein
MNVRLTWFAATLAFAALIPLAQSFAQPVDRLPQPLLQPTTAPSAKVASAHSERPSASWARLAMRAEGSERGWEIAPEADLHFLSYLARNVGAMIPVEWHTADVENLEEMCLYPILFATNDFAPILTSRGRANLREFMLRGGFLFLDDCDGPTDHDQFFRRMRTELKRIMPDADLVELDSSHLIFNLRYQVPRLPLVHGIWHPLNALVHKGRIVAVLTSTDLHCGWEGHRGSEVDARKLAFELGANIVIYALTTPPLTGISAKGASQTSKR